MERDELRPVIPAHAGIHLLCAFVDSGHRTQVANLRYWRRRLQTCAIGDAGCKRVQVANVFNWRRRLQTCTTGDAGYKPALLETQVANVRYWRRRLQTRCKLQLETRVADVQLTGDAGYKPALLETRVADVYNWRRRLQTCATGVNSLGQGETSGRLTAVSSLLP